MKIVLLGPPGAGKGSLAQFLKNKVDIAHISTGDMLREEIKSGSELGNKAKQLIDEGKLVPDDIIIDMVKSRLSKDDCKNGYILDGFPRTAAQAEALDKVVAMDLCINFSASDELLIRRICGRRVCSKCGQVYHIDHIGDAQLCSICGGTLITRKDDNVETITKRLAVYNEQTKPLIEFYREKGILLDVDGEKDTDIIYDNDLKELLK